MGAAGAHRRSQRPADRASEACGERKDARRAARPAQADRLRNRAPRRAERTGRPFDIARIGVAMHPREMRFLVARLDVHQHDVEQASSSIGGVGNTIAVASISAMLNA